MVLRRGLAWIVALTIGASVTPACGGGGGDDDGGASGEPAARGIDPAENYRITELGGDQALARVVAAPDGSTWVSWFSNPDGSNYDVRLQRFYPAGSPTWRRDGLLLSDHRSETWISDYALSVDLDGNAIVVFQDTREGPHQVVAYKVTPSGDRPWGEDGVVLSTGAGFRAPLPTTVVTAESVTVVWVDEGAGDRTEVRVQRLDQDGSPMWGEGGIPVVGGPAEDHSQPVVVPAPDGEVIVVWGSTPDPADQAFTLVAQRLDDQGAPVWGDEPVVVSRSVPSFILPSVVADGSGGAFVGWHDIDLVGHVQHLSSDGALSIEEGATAVAPDAPGLQIDVRLVRPEEDDSAIALWLSTDDDQRQRGIAAQRISGDGERAWGGEGRSIVARSAADVWSITPVLQDDRILVAFNQGDIPPDGEAAGSLDVRAWALPVPLDEVGPIDDRDREALSEVSADRSLLSGATIDADTAVFAWTDDRDGSADDEEQRPSTDVYLQDTTRVG